MYRYGRGRIFNRLKLMLTTRNMKWGECKTCMEYCSLVNVSIRMTIYQKGPLTRIPISQSPGAFVLNVERSFYDSKVMDRTHS